MQLVRWADQSWRTIDKEFQGLQEFATRCQAAALVSWYQGDVQAETGWLKRIPQWLHNKQVKKRLKELRSSVLSAPTPSKRSLSRPSQLLSDGEKYTVITGSRREYPRRSLRYASDLLLPVACGDYALLGRLPGASEFVVVDDEHFYRQSMRGPGLSEPFRQKLLCVGAPEVNVASLKLSSFSLFRFVLDDRAQHDLEQLADSLREQSTQERLGTYHGSIQELEAIVNRLCRPMFVDPLAHGFLRDKIGRDTQWQYGLISLALPGRISGCQPIPPQIRT